ncbi:MAG TPA: DUF4124 domain-containing protein [Gammaproteobacteria bacterium]|nr:DUF4124 domain-containing protein [Gammaproteobacteria bacterium]
MKKSFMLLGLAAALYLTGNLSAVADVYRCEVNGTTRYSDQPCGKQAEPVKLAPVQTVTLQPVAQAKPQATRSVTAHAKHEKPCRYDDLSSTEQRNLRVSQIIMLCEPAAAVRAAWGKPDKITRKHTHGHLREHWVYRDLNGHKKRDVALDNDRVTGFHGGSGRG